MAASAAARDAFPYRARPHLFVECRKASLEFITELSAEVEVADAGWPLLVLAVQAGAGSPKTHRKPRKNSSL
jgi:hypothetical protein